MVVLVRVFLAGGSKSFLFSSLPREMIQFDEHIFQMGWFNHQQVLVVVAWILLGLEGPPNTWCRHQEAAVDACFQRLDAEANGYITREDLTRP